MLGRGGSKAASAQAKTAQLQAKRTLRKDY